MLANVLCLALSLFEFQFLDVVFDLGECREFVDVQTGLDFVAELECWDNAVCKQDFFACTRVACRAAFAGLAGECAKATKFNGAAFDKLFAHDAEELFYNRLDVCADESGRLGDFLN